MATTFPRTLLPKRATIPRVPTGLAALGGSGKPQLRTTLQVGRIWEETWPDLRLGRADVEALLAFIAWAYSTQQILNVKHPALPGSGKDPLGAGGGTPVIAGGSQTGEDIDTSGWSANVTNVVRAGDVLKIAGLNQILQVVEDADSDGSGLATIKLNPPIASGNSPVNGAAITRTGVTLRAFIVDYAEPPGRPGQFISGLRVTFREAP